MKLLAGYFGFIPDQSISMSLEKSSSPEHNRSLSNENTKPFITVKDQHKPVTQEQVPLILFKSKRSRSPVRLSQNNKTDNENRISKTFTAS